jgi:hypothetical protein
MRHRTFLGCGKRSRDDSGDSGKTMAGSKGDAVPTVRCAILRTLLAEK